MSGVSFELTNAIDEDFSLFEIFNMLDTFEGRRELIIELREANKNSLLLVFSAIILAKYRIETVLERRFFIFWLTIRIVFE